jgi:hypothetical protein
MLINAQMRRRGTHVKPCVRHFNMSILGASNGKGQGMQEKLNMGRLFADAFRFLRARTLGLLPYLLVAVVGLMFLEFAAHSWVDSMGAVILVDLFSIVVFAGLAVLTYERALGAASNRHWLQGTLSLTLATVLIGLLFLIVTILLVMLLALVSGIVLAADGLGSIDALDSFDDFSVLISEMSTGAEIIIGLLALVCGLGLLWMAVRLVLFGIATVAQERLMIFRTWSWTKRHALRIAVFYAIFTSPVWLSIIYFATTDLAAMDRVSAGIFHIVNFLLGHAAAIAVYKQLAPATENLEAAFS